MNPMNIVQILPEMDEGGVEGETLDFAIYLAGQGHNSIVVSGGGRLVGQLEAAGVRHITWPHIGEKSFRCLKYLNKLRRLYLDENIDVVHLRSRLPAWVGYLAWKLITPAQRPTLITTFHGFYSINCYSAIMTKGEYVVAVSQVIKDHILANYEIDESRLTIIHGGCDMQAFDPGAVIPERVKVIREHWQVPQDNTPIVMLPGRLTHWKGQHVFIESLNRIKDLHFYAVCVGELEAGSSYVEKLQNAIDDYGLDEKVKLVGHCSDIPAALLAADIIVSASSSQPEAFGKVAIEAMAMGRPVIATKHGGSLETIEDNTTGWFVAPDDPHEMAMALRKVLLNRKLLEDAGKKGRQRVIDHFTAERMCEKTLSLYKQANGR
jgi:glycosyltransferase involved in cell wall biosynthesis